MFVVLIFIVYNYYCLSLVENIFKKVVCHQVLIPHWLTRKLTNMKLKFAEWKFKSSFKSFLAMWDDHVLLQQLLALRLNITKSLIIWWQKSQICEQLQPLSRLKTLFCPGRELLKYLSLSMAGDKNLSHHHHHVIKM